MTSYSFDEYSNYRLQRATETLKEVEVLIENGFWNAAVNRLYYACFYAVGPLLIKQGVVTASHSGLRQKFGQLFIKTGKINRELGRHYSDLFEKRHRGDYNDFFDHSEETVLKLSLKSKEFIQEISDLIANE